MTSATGFPEQQTVSASSTPLAAYRVLDLTSGGAMLCGHLLAGLGADVIAVEPPGGSPSRSQGSFWQAYARGKRSLALDPANQGDRAAFRELAARADFVLESFEPGYMTSLGLGYAELARRNPGLVMVSITPFGQDGPKSHWRAADITTLAASGVLLLTGDADRPPVQVPGEQSALHAGAEAAAAALIALQARQRDGVGQHVDVSAQATMILATQGFALSALWNDPVEVTRTAGGAMVGGRHIRYVYPCKDGHVSIAFLFGNVIGPFTRRLFEWLCEEGVVDEATRDKDWVAYFELLLTGREPASELARCTAAIEEFTRTRTKAELFAGAMERRLLIVPVSTIGEVVASEQLAARGYWRPGSDDESDGLPHPGAFAQFRDCPVPHVGQAPGIGEHNDEVFGEWTGSDNRSPPVGADPGSGDQPLEGLRVVDLSWVYATPFGVRMLADYGATVIHVESRLRPDTLRSAQPAYEGILGPERSAQYANAQANKLGLALNLQTPAARQVVLELARWADVLVESFTPGTMEAWGLDYEALRRVNPRLIMLSSSLCGQTGPLAHLAGFGIMGQQLAGFGEITGWPDRPPAGPFTAYTDYTAPKLVALAILAALDRLHRTGEGGYIDFSQVEAALHYLSPALLDYGTTGRSAGREGNASPYCSPHGAYPCAGEERWITLACRDEKEWLALRGLAGPAAGLDDPLFATFDSRRANAAELDARIGEWTRQQDVDQIEEALQSAGVAAHRASTSADLAVDPQLAHRGHFVEVPHAEIGTVVIESSRVRLSRTPHRDHNAGPVLGEHTEMVLRDLIGLEESRIAEIAAEGALD